MSVAGERIKECRLINRMTQDDVAKHLGIGKQAVWKYETGIVTNIPLDNLESMAALFRTTPAYLAGWSDEGAPESLLDDREDSLVSSFRSLSPRGQELLLERAEELKLLYGKKSESNAAESV
jgi:transcriptional regulator with XRE-family HTH domain